ncbi:MAG: hypothetical protein FD166_1443 [Bacteroidetes bacterium]|nr:MAG: hypothetical protein FD166_1443 [Bacteroidota bacterium]
MNLTEDQLKEIESMAALFFSPEEIAENIEVDPEEFLLLIKSQTGEGYLRYMRGRLGSEVDLRRAIQQAALHGSTPAQQMMRDWHNRSKYD